ncbi:MAG: YbjQ family protein [Bacteroidales bacterium]|nr:YbjQ family protein [Bacteroidales bacterium]
MLLASIDTIPGKNIEVLGIVKGTVVQSKHIGRDILAGLKTIVGGEIQGYTDMLIEARSIATERMTREAEALGADAVIGMRYCTSAVMEGAAEIVAYGTAVKFV